MSIVRSIRKTCTMTQQEFCKEMGVALRTLQDIEGGIVEEREIHINAARWAWAVATGRVEGSHWSVGDGGQRDD